MGNSVTIQGGSSSNFSGLVYAPNAAVTLNNGTGTNLTMDFVAQNALDGRWRCAQQLCNAEPGNTEFIGREIS
jgi:hypothetical protein